MTLQFVSSSTSETSGVFDRIQAAKHLPTFCTIMLNPERFNDIYSIYSAGLKNLYPWELTGDVYSLLIMGLWTEIDRGKALNFLRSRSPELSAPLMFEQAITEFECLSTAETIRTISIPILNSALFRTIQDLKYSDLISQININYYSQFIFMTYLKRLDNLAKNILNSDLKTIYDEDPDQQKKAIRERLLNTAHLSQQLHHLPSPRWLDLNILHDPTLPTEAERPEDSLALRKFNQNMYAQATIDEWMDPEFENEYDSSHKLEAHVKHLIESGYLTEHMGISNNANQNQFLDPQHMAAPQLQDQMFRGIENGTVERTEPGMNLEDEEFNWEDFSWAMAVEAEEKAAAEKAAEKAAEEEK